jgi:predicted AAA+ superfamily ATPase
MFRQISIDLQCWLQRKDRRPLLLRGARQVGKTWLARALAREQGLDLVEVNFELRPDAKEAFRSLQPSEILKNLAFLGFPVPKPGSSLLFFDEIQDCPAAIAALRYFYEIMPELAVLASGSLLEFAMNAGEFSLPVGRVDTMWVHPMGFAEFLRAKGNETLAGALESLNPIEPLPAVAHRKAMEELRDYLFCGGMPAAVNALADDRDVEACRRVHLSILQTYRQDFAKYAPRIKADIAERLFLRAPGLVGGRLKFNAIDPDHRSSEVRPAVEAVEKAGVIRRVFHSAGQSLPLATDSNPRIAKLVMLDVGLMHAALRIDAEFIQEPDLLAIHRGAVAEQFAAQELLACGPADREPELYFWAREERSSQAEVDFLIASGPKVLPIEIKSGSSGTLKSLNLFLDSHHQSPLGVRLYGGPHLRENRILHLPLYAAGTLHRLRL